MSPTRYLTPAILIIITWLSTHQDIFCGSRPCLAQDVSAEQDVRTERVEASDVAIATQGIDGIEFFEKQIRPLLVAHCYECHSLVADKRQGGLLLDSLEGWKKGGDNGAVIFPGDPDGSQLIQAVRHSDGDAEMPPDKSLSARQIASLVAWVRMGAPDPRDDRSEVMRQHSRASDPIEGRRHWAFRRLSDRELPPVANREWPRSDIDTLVLANLESQSLAPAGDADRRTLIRRLSFQLTGLPPTNEQLKDFIHDQRANAYARLVDRLLNSSAFGERWGRHWLDLARYSDSNGLDENFLFREAWRYRNWVIDALNHDMPFDRFQRQQIAGDLLPYHSVEQRDRQRIASGFLVVGPKVLLGNDPKERRMDIADEQLDTIGKTFLAQTVGCARCHDHKFDPIPTADYYAMAGIFTSTRVLETRYMLGQQREMEQLVGIGSRGEELDQSYEEYWRNQPAMKTRLEKARAALDLLKARDEEGLASLVEKHSDAVAEVAVALQTEQSLRITAQEDLLAELTEAIKPLPIPPRTMAPVDIDSPRDEAIRLAGQFDRHGETVPRGVLRVISHEALQIPDGTSGRLEFSQWLVDQDDGAGMLVARVTANRIWHHLIGSGIVRTVDNFGRTGEPPSHPELLDLLASKLLQSGWSMKSLIREIVMSRTFTMSSRHNASHHDIDPDNRWLWRANRRRLDPESLRDAMLLHARELDFAPMQSSVWYLGDQATAVGANKNRRRTDFPCRSVYLPVIRNDLPELFEAFDFADPHATTGRRPATIAADQALFLMNDKSVMDAADRIATRLLDGDSSRSDHEIAEALCLVVLSRDAPAELLESVVDFANAMKRQFREQGDADHELHAWSAACHAMLASSNFQVLE